MHELSTFSSGNQEGAGNDLRQVVSHDVHVIYSEAAHTVIIIRCSSIIIIYKTEIIDHKKWNISSQLQPLFSA